MRQADPQQHTCELGHSRRCSEGSKQECVLGKDHPIQDQRRHDATHDETPVLEDQLSHAAIGFVNRTASATEALDPEVMARLIPKRRNIVDTRKVVVYFRPSPDGRRVLFGGRAAAMERDVVRCLPRLAAMMAEIFPELAETPISRAWMGFVAFTFDTMPHLGSRDGVFYCMGYCGQGVPLSIYYGRRIGRQMADRRDGRTALDGLAFPARPFYRGWPWFLPLAIAGYRLRDRLAL